MMSDDHSKEDMLEIAEKCVKLALTVAKVEFDEANLKIAVEKVYKVYYEHR